MDEVLVVDDDPATCKAVALLLRTVGHVAQCLPSGDEVLRVLDEGLQHREKPRLVVLDVMMRGMDGLEVLRRIRSNSEMNDVIVVMYSALLDPELREQATKLGAQAFVVKSGGWAALYPCLQQYLN